MNNIRQQLEERVQHLNEDAGRGRGPQLGQGAKSALEAGVKGLRMGYLNQAPTTAKYNFNNYYTLDVRIKADKLDNAWRSGKPEYQTNFSKIFNQEMEDDLKEAVRIAHQAYYEEEWMKLASKGFNEEEISSKMKVKDHHASKSGWKSSPFEDLKQTPSIKYVYNEMPVVSVFPINGKDKLIIKPDEFVPMIMNGMISAVRGNVPQGVTVEEIMEGKFSRKAIAPEQGTFINRVKDPTSDKPFDFRSADTTTLMKLHDIIMSTFKYATNLQITDAKVSSAIGSPSTRASLFLYMSQEDFNQFEKGGQGFKDLSKKVVDHIKAVDEPLDF